MLLQHWSYNIFSIRRDERIYCVVWVLVCIIQEMILFIYCLFPTSYNEFKQELTSGTLVITNLAKSSMNQEVSDVMLAGVDASPPIPTAYSVCGCQSSCSPHPSASFPANTATTWSKILTTCFNRIIYTCVCVCSGELNPNRMGSGIQYGDHVLRNMTRNVNTHNSPLKVPKCSGCQTWYPLPPSYSPSPRLFGILCYLLISFTRFNLEYLLLTI